MELTRVAKFPLMGAATAALRAKCRDSSAVRGLAILIDQVVASGTNFVTTVVLGRACLPEELGMYALGFSLVVMLMGIPRSLIWQPYTTFTPGMSDDECRRYTGSTLVHQAVLCVGMGVMISAAGAGMVSRGDAHGLGDVFVILGPAMALMLLREYVRRICFARLRDREALLIDIAVAVLQISGMVMLAISGALTAARAYLVIACAGAPVMAAWILANRRNMMLSRKGALDDWRKIWGFARWILAGALVTSFISAFSPWALSWFHGTSSAGVLAAGLSVVALINPLVLAYQNYLGPEAAFAYATRGVSGLCPLVTRATLAMAALAAVFTLGFAIWGEDALVVLYGGTYARYGDVVTALVLCEFAFLVTIPAVCGLLALGRGDILLRSNLVQLVLSLTIGLWCIQEFGPAGVGYGGLASGLGSGLWKWTAFRSLVRDLAEARS
jgi:O-antigen/teichoic acid export membrane protein